MNEIVFPAAILQPPFFDADADDAVNYGGIGAVIGHEIGHGFDDQGSKYDGDGRLEDWWTAEDRAEFETRTKALIDQYSRVLPRAAGGSHHVNGELTIGENIGDLGGLSIAFKAYRIALGTPLGGGARDRRAHRRAARAARLGAGLAGEGSRRGDHPTARHGPALPQRVPLQRRGAQRRRVLRRRSTSSRATRCTSLPRSASASGEDAPGGARGPGGRRHGRAARTRWRGPAGSPCPTRRCTARRRSRSCTCSHRRSSR